MGSGSSTQLSEGSLKQAADVLAQKTKPTRDVVDVLFKYMINELKINDFYKLTSPEECAKYVAFLGSRLEPLFYDLKVMPSKGKDGTIYFQKLDQLQKFTEADKADRKSTCLFIAYFYIRVFQIYGALALTLIDDVRSFVENRAYQTAAEYIASLDTFNLQLGDPLGTVGAPYGQRSIQRGGAGVEPIEGKTSEKNKQADTILGGTELRFLLHKSIIPDKTADGRNLPVTYPGDKNVLKNITFAFKTTINKVWVNINKPTASFVEEENQGFFAFLLSGTTITTSPTPSYYMIIQLPFTATMLDDNSIKIEFDKSMILTTYSVTKKKDIDDVLNIVNSTLGTESKRSFQITMASDAQQYAIKGTNLPFPSLIIAIRDYFVKSYNELLALLERTPDETKLTTTNDMIERSTMNVRQLLQGRTGSAWLGSRPGQGRDDYARGYYGDTRRSQEGNLYQFMSTDTKAHEAIQLSKMLRPLMNTRPYAYCVSRGLRLLSSVQQAMPPEWKTSVCDTKFLLDKAGATHDGAPASDKTLETNPGILSLSQLFFDTVKSTTPDITMSPQSLQQYSMFLTKMYQLYTGDTRTQINPTEKPLTKMRPEYVRGVCDPTKPKITPVVPPSAINEVWARVKALFGRQVIHSANCGKLFKELFFMKRLENRSLYVSIHPNIVKGGIPQLDRLTAKARDLLTAYYVDCENGYKAGVQTLATATERQQQEKQQEKQQEQQQQGQQVQGQQQVQRQGQQPQQVQGQQQRQGQTTRRVTFGNQQPPQQQPPPGRQRLFRGGSFTRKNTNRPS